ncbi:hypothetical protein [Vibrio harveyi]|uniref:hypothetical protein n=1 Tax=Vibrio harveyi TaxID=669 RepID=UPI003BB5752E|nr:hypothetical protein [Vibrio harveyi]
MNKEQINKVFGVPVATQTNWEKNRPDYAKYLDKGLTLIELLPKEVVTELFAADKPKQINQTFGIESNFAKTEMKITPSTVSDWMANGRNKLYIGLITGAILDKLEPILVENNKTLTDLYNSDIDIVDFIYVWRHRPAVVQALTRTL